jgi:hypothetical protein
MSTYTVVVRLGGIIIFAAVICFALYVKGNVRAGGKIGPGSFFIQAEEKQKR